MRKSKSHYYCIRNPIFFPGKKIKRYTANPSCHLPPQFSVPSEKEESECVLRNRCPAATKWRSSPRLVWRVKWKVRKKGGYSSPPPPHATRDYALILGYSLCSTNFRTSILGWRPSGSQSTGGEGEGEGRWKFSGLRECNIVRKGRQHNDDYNSTEEKYLHLRAFTWVINLKRYQYHYNIITRDNSLRIALVKG